MDCSHLTFTHSNEMDSASVTSSVPGGDALLASKRNYIRETGVAAWKPPQHTQRHARWTFLSGVPWFSLVWCLTKVSPRPPPIMAALPFLRAAEGEARPCGFGLLTSVFPKESRSGAIVQMNIQPRDMGLVHNRHWMLNEGIFRSFQPQQPRHAGTRSRTHGSLTTGSLLKDEGLHETQSGQRVPRAFSQLCQLLEEALPARWESSPVHQPALTAFWPVCQGNMPGVDCEGRAPPLTQTNWSCWNTNCHSDGMEAFQAVA